MHLRHRRRNIPWLYPTQMTLSEDSIAILGRLATGVLGAVVFAALILAVLVQERHPKADDLTKEARQAERALLPNANPATRFTVVGWNGKSSTEKMTSGQASSVDHAFTEISPKEIPSSQMEAAASTPTPVLAFTPEINRLKAGSSSP